MKYTVQINSKDYEVEILDLETDPVLVTVNGEEIRVWKEKPSAKAAAVRPAGQPQITAKDTRMRAQPANSAAQADPKMVRSPIPGVIVSVSVQKGDAVELGQELCVLEAMKMKNVIRSPRVGVIAAVHVASGKTVQHSDPLVEYEE